MTEGVEQQTPESGAGSRAETPVVVFIHIPKTAGTSVAALVRQNDPDGVSRLPNVFKASGGGVRANPYERMADRHEIHKSARFLSGHMPLAGRKNLPQDMDVVFMTFLRNPVERALSHYFLLMELAEQPRRRPVEHPLIDKVPLKERFTNLLYVPDNLHTRMLSDEPEPIGEVTEETLEQAKKNLSTQFAMFGIAERFEESLVLLKRRFGYRHLLTGDARVSESRPRGNRVPADVLKWAQRANAVDMELYRFAEELFDKTPDLKELDFKIELGALRSARNGKDDATVKLPRGADPGALIIEARRELLEREAELATEKIARDKAEKAVQELKQLVKLPAEPPARERKRRRATGGQKTAGQSGAAGKSAARKPAGSKAAPATGRKRGGQAAGKQNRAGADKSALLEQNVTKARTRLADLKREIRELSITAEAGAGDAGMEAVRARIDALEQEHHEAKMRVGMLELRLNRSQEGSSTAPARRTRTTRAKSDAAPARSSRPRTAARAAKAPIVDWTGLDTEASRSDGKLLVGKEGWVFLARDSNQVLRQHTGELLFSRSQLEQWRKVLEARKAWVEERGGHFLQMVPPNPHSVFPDMLPEDVESGKTRPILQLIDHLKEKKSPASIIYPIEELQAAKSELIYPKTDSHWSALGAFIAYRRFLDDLDESVPRREVTRDDIDFEVHDFPGGLGAKVDPPLSSDQLVAVLKDPKAELIGDNLVWRSGRTIRFECAEAPETSCVVFGDSFSYAMLRYLAETFRRFCFVHLATLDRTLPDALAADVILCSVNERFAIRVPDDQNGPTTEQAAEEKRQAGALVNPSVERKGSLKLLWP